MKKPPDWEMIDREIAASIAHCPTGKRAHATRADAKAFSKRTMGQHHRKMRVYRCPHCDFFHLTKISAARSEAIRQYEHDRSR